MENFKLPAYPTADFSGGVRTDHPGFTKLELASLLIAASIAAPIYSEGLSAKAKSQIAAQSVVLAKAILEEANK